MDEKIKQDEKVCTKDIYHDKLYENNFEIN